MPADGGGPYPYRFAFADAIGHEPGVTRRDPSDVFQVGDEYYVWYTKVLKSQRGYPSGYPGSVWYATSPDGKAWTEQGLALEPGPDDVWDGHGVFTPNILVHGGKYYLYYTAVPEPFDVPWTLGKTPTAIGVAVADTPNGPWRKSADNPILIRSDKAEDFDSFRVDDAALVARDDKIWLYYKGRSLVHGKAGPGKTRMGVAISASPCGPFAKQDANPLHSGHEVLVWPHGKGVASLATAAGPRMIYFAEDGLKFQPRNAAAGAPGAPGAFRSDRFVNNAVGTGIQWGICHGIKKGDVYLRRFDCDFTPIRVSGARRGPLPVPYDNAKPAGSLRFDFETGDLQGWAVVEGKFDLVICDRPWLPQWLHVPFNKQGKFHLSTVATRGGKGYDDGMVGIIESAVFVLKGPKMSFLVGGGNSEETYVALCSEDDEELMRAGGTNSPVLRRITWDVSAHIGKKVSLRLVDQKRRVWAHLTFDDFSTEGEIDPETTAARRLKVKN